MNLHRQMLVGVVVILTGFCLFFYMVGQAQYDRLKPKQRETAAQVQAREQRDYLLTGCVGLGVVGVVGAAARSFLREVKSTKEYGQRERKPWEM